MIYCTNCGTGNMESAHFCARCGADLTKIVTIPPVTSRERAFQPEYVPAQQPDISGMLGNEQPGFGRPIDLIRFRGSRIVFLVFGIIAVVDAVGGLVLYLLLSRILQSAEAGIIPIIAALAFGIYIIVSTILGIAFLSNAKEYKNARTILYENGITGTTASGCDYRILYSEIKGISTEGKYIIIDTSQEHDYAVFAPGNVPSRLLPVLFAKTQIQPQIRETTDRTGDIADNQ